MACSRDRLHRPKPDQDAQAQAVVRDIIIPFLLFRHRILGCLPVLRGRRQASKQQRTTRVWKPPPGRSPSSCHAHAPIQRALMPSILAVSVYGMRNAQISLLSRPYTIRYDRAHIIYVECVAEESRPRRRAGIIPAVCVVVLTL